MLQEVRVNHTGMRADSACHRWAAWMAAGARAQVTSAPEASGCLVAPPVFKTGVRRAASQAGSIPVRLRQCPDLRRRPEQLLAGSRKGLSYQGKLRRSFPGWHIWYVTN